jgi:APA family basic amino acid/polyamine antiporter
MATLQPESRLARRLGLGDAVGIGLGAMLGAGVFAAPAPAARLAGSGVLAALVIAGLVAWANAISTARLAAVQPEAGGVYAFGRKRIGPTAGFTAGWAFTAGKIASLTAMALTFGAYAWPDQPRAAGLVAVAVLTAVNLAGVHRTAKAAILGAIFVGGVLVLAGGATIGSASATAESLRPILGTHGLHGLLGAAGVMFFAFAGYARIATLGEEVRDPERTIPRAVPIALITAFIIYALTTTGSLLVLGSAGLADSNAPLVDAARLAVGPWLGIAVRAGATVAILGVLLSLLAGVARTAFAMAADGELPKVLAAVHGRTQVPHRAQIAVGVLVSGLVLTVPTMDAIATSSLLILTYYSIAHLSALRLSVQQKRPRLLAPFGLIGCVALGLNLPGADVVTGLAILSAGLLARAVVRQLRKA